MTDRPIIFSAPMVRAILAGRKTQTRRPAWRGDVWLDGKGRELKRSHWQKVRPGDRLWVRETWAPLSAFPGADPGVQALIDRGFYRADDGTTEGDIARWTPAIHMPRWASRITLEVEGVKVERLQAISKTDVIAEGLTERDGYPLADVHAGWHEPFAALWESLHGAGAWDLNPEVVAITFSVARQDRIAA